MKITTMAKIRIKRRKNEKKLLSLFLMITMVFSFMLSACNGSMNASDDGSIDPSESVMQSSEIDGESDSSVEEEPKEPKPIEEVVDFVVDVETGRDIRVLQLTDIQTISCDQKRYEERVTPNQPADTFNGYEKYIGQVIEGYDPDLIIMTGDNTYGEFDDYGEQLLGLIKFMDSYKIPWAPIFGNHDNESNMGVDWQCEQFENSEYCLFKQRELTGNGNYSVGLTQGGELKRVFYMLDSNGCENMSAISLANGHSTTAVGFGQDQIEWYSQSMEDVKESYPEAKLSMAFHIQLSVFADAFKLYGYDALTIRNNPIDLDELPEAQAAGDFGYIGRELKSPWDHNDKVWNTIKEYGVDSVFVGHEHCNSASIEYEGVRLTYGQKSSTFDRYNSDENGPVMGGTYIDISEVDGKIADAGLYLYDHELGYEKPDEDDTGLTMDNLPDGATVTELDFNGTDFVPMVSTETIRTLRADKITDTMGVPEGFTGDVYGKTTNDLSCVGIRFKQTVNADRLLGVFVRMYVSDYTVQSGKTPMLRIYNDLENSILSEGTYADLGGKTAQWVYVNILELLKNANGIINDGKISPFTLLYRFYGATEGTVYFDSLTLVSDGDPYTFDTETDGPNTVRGEICNQYSLSELTDATGALGSGDSVFAAIDEDSYSVKFSLTPETFTSTLWVYGYMEESSPRSGICVRFTKGEVKINSGSGTFAFADGKTYDIEVGFVKLFNGNTVYTFVKVNGTLVVWELVEAYGKTAGNILIASSNGNSFTLA